MNNFLFCFLLLSKLSFAQTSYDKIIFLDDSSKETTSSLYKTKRVIKDYNLEKECYEVFDYNTDNKLVFESTCTDKYTFSRNGDFIAYHENGTKKSLIHYQKSKPVGEYKEWYSDGKTRLEGSFTEEESFSETNYKVFQFWNPEGKQEVIDGNGFFNYAGEEESFQGKIVKGVKDGYWKGTHTDGKTFTELYDNGKFIAGESIDENNKRIVYSELEKKPEPKKGIQDFYRYISKNFTYTKEATKNNISGKIIVMFIVEKDGKLSSPVVVKALGYGLDEEAIRVLMKYDEWNPGKQRGRNVRVQYSLPITLAPSN